MNRDAILEPIQSLQTPVTIHVPKYKYIHDAFRSVIFLSMISLFTKQFFSLDEKILSEEKSKYVISCIVGWWFFTFQHLKSAIINFIYEDQEMLQSEYQKRLSFGSKKIAQFFMVCDVYFFLVQLTLSTQFIPFQKETCDGYTHSVCSVVRLWAVFGLIESIILGLQILVAIYWILYICIYENRLRNAMRTERNNLLSIFRENDIFNAHSVFTNVTVYDYECPICLCDGTESDNCNFVTLNCGHKYHKNCIERWISTGYNLNCPTCRNPINNETIYNQNINSNEIA